MRSRSFKLMTLSALSAFVGTAALAEDMPSVTKKDEGAGVKAGLEVGYISASKMYDVDGKSQDMLFDGKATSMTFDVKGAYSLGQFVPGLSVGASIPVVKNGLEMTPPVGDEVSASSFGLGDVSLYGRYAHTLSDTMQIGGQLRFKLATGKWDELKADEAPLGDGFNHLYLSAFAKLMPVSNVNVDIDLGYGITMGHEETMTVGTESAKVDLNPGDIMYGRVGAGYTLMGNLTPSIALQYLKTGEDSAEGETAKDTDSNSIVAMIDVNYAVNDMLNVSAGIGSSMIGMGTYLDTGYALSGKNSVAGALPIHLAVSGAF